MASEEYGFDPSSEWSAMGSYTSKRTAWDRMSLAAERGAGPSGRLRPAKLANPRPLVHFARIFRRSPCTIASPSSRSPPSSRARPGMQETNPERGASSASTGQASQIDENAKRMVAQGRDIFRDDTLGSEDYFGAALKLHQAIAGEKNGGVGGGVSPKTALSVGLKVDAERVPGPAAAGIKDGSVSLDDPANTLALLKANAVVGVKGIFSGDRLTSGG